MLHTQKYTPPHCFIGKMFVYYIVQEPKEKKTETKSTREAPTTTNGEEGVSTAKDPIAENNGDIEKTTEKETDVDDVIIETDSEKEGDEEDVGEGTKY